MNIPTDAELLANIRAFLARHDMKPTRFGRDATGEAQLISSIESGRSPSLNTLQRVADFMAERDAAIGFVAEADSQPPFSGATAVEGPQGSEVTALPSDRPATFPTPSSATCSPTNDRPAASTTCPTCSTDRPGDGREAGRCSTGPEDCSVRPASSQARVDAA